ncbi:MAG TPA: hypothetical protein VGF13_14980 [Verrucomicrobiae bacterium]
MNVKRDDSAVVYLNGSEAARFNMNIGQVNHLTLARNGGDLSGIVIQGHSPPATRRAGTMNTTILQ